MFPCHNFEWYSVQNTEDKGIFIHYETSMLWTHDDKLRVAPPDPMLTVSKCYIIESIIDTNHISYDLCSVLHKIWTHKITYGYL